MKFLRDISCGTNTDITTTSKKMLTVMICMWNNYLSRYVCSDPRWKIKWKRKHLKNQTTRLPYHPVSILNSFFLSFFLSWKKCQEFNKNKK